MDDQVKNKEVLCPIRGFPGGSGDKESVCNAGDLALVPGLGRSPGKGNGNPLQYSCLGNSMDRGGWWITVHGIAKVWTNTCPIRRLALMTTHTEMLSAITFPIVKKRSFKTLPVSLLLAPKAK